MLLFIQLYAILFYLAIGNASLMLLINLLTYLLYNLSYIILVTEINFQNAVTFVLVKLDTKFKVQNS